MSDVVDASARDRAIEIVHAILPGHGNIVSAATVVDHLPDYPDVLRGLCPGPHLVPVDEEEDTW